MPTLEQGAHGPHTRDEGALSERRVLKDSVKMIHTCATPTSINFSHFEVLATGAWFPFSQAHVSCVSGGRRACQTGGTPQHTLDNNAAAHRSHAAVATKTKVPESHIVVNDVGVWMCVSRREQFARVRKI